MDIDRVVNSCEFKEELDGLSAAFQQSQAELGQTRPSWYHPLMRLKFDREYHATISRGVCPFCHKHKLIRIDDSVDEIPPSGDNVHAYYTSLQYVQCGDCDRVLEFSARNKGGAF